MSRPPPAPPHVSLPAPSVVQTPRGPVVFSGPSGPNGWHSRQVKSECMQKGAYFHVLQLEPVEGRAALVVGSIVHQGIAQHWARVGNLVWPGGRGPRFRPELATPVEAGHYAADQMRADRQMRDRGVGVIADYLSQIDDPTSVKFAGHVIGVETRLETRIAGRPYTQRADRVVWRDGVWVVDTKTTGRIEGKALRGWAMSGQFAGYRLLGRRQWGADFRGCLVERLQTEPFKMQTSVLPGGAGADRAFERGVQDIDERWEGLVASGRDPWEFPRVMSELMCVHRYGTCDYLDLCLHGKSALAAFTGRHMSVPDAGADADAAPELDDLGVVDEPREVIDVTPEYASLD